MLESYSKRLLLLVTKNMSLRQLLLSIHVESYPQEVLVCSLKCVCQVLIHPASLRQ